jgi:hypothetical protein
MNANGTAAVGAGEPKRFQRVAMYIVISKP